MISFMLYAVVALAVAVFVRVILGRILKDDGDGLLMLGSIWISLFWPISVPLFVFSLSAWYLSAELLRRLDK